MQTVDENFSVDISDKLNEKKTENNQVKSKVAGIILGVSGAAACIAGVLTAKVTKKKSNEYCKDVNIEQKVIFESPRRLALKALALSTLLSLDDLRRFIKSKQKEKKLSEKEAEIKTFSDLLEYLNESSKAKTDSQDS